MRQSMRICILSLLVLAFAAGPAWAFRYWGAKPLGMGGAFSAVADDTNAIHWNPAGLTIFNSRKQAGFSFNYERSEYILGDYQFLHPELFEDTSETDDFGSEIYYEDEEPVDLEKKMVGDWYHFALVDGKTSKAVVAGLAFTGKNFPSHTFSEGEDYSVDLALAGGFAELLSIGVTGRYVQTLADNAGEFDVDVGAMVDAVGIIGVGIVGRNLFGNEEPDIVRREIALGVAGFIMEYATISAEATKVFDVEGEEGTFNFAFGVEGVINPVALRAGFNWDRVAEARLWSAGIAVVDSMGTLAYTFQDDVDEVRNFVHSIQISVFF